MYALPESVTISKIKKPSCTLLILEVLLCLVAFPSSRAQCYDTIIFPDEPDLMSSDDRNVCSTPECIDTASRVLSYMDESLNPCDNFYKFACGKFINTGLKHGVKSVHQFSLIEDNISQQMINYLQNGTLPTLPRYARLIKTFYNSCTDNSFYNKAKERTLNSIMKLINKTNGWPLLKNVSWEDKNYQWEKFVFQNEDGNFLNESIINFQAVEFLFGNDGISQRPINQPAKFVTSRELYNNLLSFGQLFGVEKNDVENSLEKMLKVNNKLQEIYKPNNNENYSSEEISVNELVQKYPNISWKEFFNTRLKPNVIDDDEVIYVDNISYFEKLNKFIPTISKRDLANYLMWRAIDEIAASYFYLLKEKNNRSQTCYDIMFTNFNNAMQFFYVKNNFNNVLFPNETDKMIHSIHEEYSTIIKNSSWLDNETKHKALEKLESIIFQSPSQYFSYDKEIDEYFKSLEITPGDYFQSLLNITEFNSKQESIELPSLSPGNKKSWKHLHRATDVHASYLDEDNYISLLPALFQGVLYDDERPKYMNYGSMGSIIAHEITHAFDTEGGYWLSPEADSKFYRKLQCITNQHNHYRVEEIELNLNGNKTQREDTADYVGIKVAYSAYEKYMATYGSEPLLPGVNYTQRKLFWISYAQRLCEKKTAEGLIGTDQDDPHSVSEVRVNGPLSNSLKFAEDFHCEPNTQMNPVDKCTFW